MWIKREPRTRIRVADGVCCKTYVVPWHLAWRGFLRRSRARREHDNLLALGAAGIPALQAVAWRERRWLGMPIESTIETVWRDGTRDLREWLRGDREHEVAVAWALGRALARLHDAGFVCYTASPRNWLLPAGGSVTAGNVVVCDVTLLARRRGSVRGRRAADVDLYSLVLGASRRRQLSRAFRMRLLLAYSGDRVAARALWRRVGRWSRLAFRLRKKLGVLVSACLGVGSRGSAMASPSGKRAEPPPAAPASRRAEPRAPARRNRA